MSEAILLVLWIGTVLFFIIREIKAKENKESHEWWISDLRDCLHRITSEFSRECYKIAEKALSQRNYSSYWSQISELKKEYVDNLYVKAAEKMGKYRLTTDIPEYIIREYERDISQIVDIHYNLDNILREKIH